MQPVVQALGIGKSFGTTVALRDISFEVLPGEVFGFIGPDGAGKTTLFRIITTLLLPDAGEIQVMGFDVRRDYRGIRKNIGYMPGRFSLYMDLTVEENLRFYATVFGTTVEENYDLIRDIYSQIEPFKHRMAGKLSGGMKQKLALSCALIHKPSLLILDEPTTGVDAVSRAEFWEMLKKLKAHNITIVVSTPYMDEATRCDRVALIQNGRIFSVDTPDHITAGFSRPLLQVKSASKHLLMNALKKYPGTLSVWPFGEYVHLTLRDVLPEEPLPRFLERHGIRDATLMEAKPGIEDRFLELMSGAEPVPEYRKEVNDDQP
ncbi:MAG TPA: ABC transporter ATP-binding protein [Bacteroidales bacterium]|nr:ABC transporter ATP-binding protein [Bacteroidales bacterium]HRZ48166.1 ABC transporter ATP-binding protein [Bacteroidales bacterium]